MTWSCRGVVREGGDAESKACQSNQRQTATTDPSLRRRAQSCSAARLRTFGVPHPPREPPTCAAEFRPAAGITRFLSTSHSLFSAAAGRLDALLLRSMVTTWPCRDLNHATAAAWFVLRSVDRRDLISSFTEANDDQGHESPIGCSIVQADG